MLLPRVSLAAILVAFLSLGPGLHAQSPDPLPTNADLRAQVHALEQELSRLQAGYKVLLTACEGSPPAPSPHAAATDGTSRSDRGRQDALAALRALQSLVAGGAHTLEFDAYYLKAKVKVDALPKSQETMAIREVTAIYADAAFLFVAVQAGRMDADHVRYFRQKYSSDPTFPFENVFGGVPDGGFGFPGDEVVTSQLGSLGAERGGSMLLDLAARKLQAIP
jgi:hypothetical protein